MKIELDKSKVYSLSDVSIEELNLINKYLSKEYENWELFTLDQLREISRKDVLYFDELKECFLLSDRLEPTTNAKELFEPQYEVTMIAEAPNEFKEITNSICDLLEYKNKKYGNSALEPLNIFTNKCKVGQRLDDKLARIKNSNDLKKNDVVDLIGYLILTCKENNWTNFDEFKD